MRINLQSASMAWCLDKDDESDAWVPDAAVAIGIAIGIAIDYSLVGGSVGSAMGSEVGVAVGRSV
jgi:hypothetical protein